MSLLNLIKLDNSWLQKLQPCITHGTPSGRCEVWETAVGAPLWILLLTFQNAIHKNVLAYPLGRHLLTMRIQLCLYGGFPLPSTRLPPRGLWKPAPSGTCSHQM